MIFVSLYFIVHRTCPTLVLTCGQFNMRLAMARGGEQLPLGQVIEL